MASACYMWQTITFEMRVTTTKHHLLAHTTFLYKMATSKLKELYVQKIIAEMYVMNPYDMLRILSDFMLRDYEKYDDTFIHSCILNELNERYDEKTVAEFLRSVEEAELTGAKAHTNLTLIN